MDVSAAGSPGIGHYGRSISTNVPAPAAGAHPSSRCGPSSASAGSSEAVFSERVLTLAANRSRSLQLEVMTQEGDRVTLTLASADALQLSSYQAASPTTMAAGVGASFSASGSFSYTVEGELSVEESADIQDLLGQVGEFAERFFAGDIDGLLSRVNESGFDMKELASFSLQMDMTRSVQATAYQSVQAMAEDAASSSSLPAFTYDLSAARSASAGYKDLFDALLKSAVQLLQATHSPVSPAIDSTATDTSILLDQLLSTIDAAAPDISGLEDGI